MKGEKFTTVNPTPKPGKRTDRNGNPIPDEFVANESSEAAVLESEAISEKQIDKEVDALDKLLAGDDSAFDELDY